MKYSNKKQFRSKKVFSNKKGLQMTVNTITALILALMVFGAGFALLQNIGEKGDDWQKKINSRFEEEARNRVNEGQPIYVTPKAINIEDKKEKQIVYLGILNIFSEEMIFKFAVEEGIDVPVNSVLYSGNEDFSIKAKEAESFVMALNVKDYPPGESTVKIIVSYKKYPADMYIQYKSPVLIYINN